MPGRIRDEDIALVRDKTMIADVIGEQVQLRNAGGGNLKGLCPFHDEKSPSFSVSPTRGLYYCFGCGAGGDVIRFVQQTERLDFSEAVERLADQVGITLRYVEGSSAPRPHGQRSRLVEAHAAAAAFYAEQLAGPEALTAREFLAQRGFDQSVAERFGCGFAPAGWDALTRHLLNKGFGVEELVLAGLSKPGGRGGHIDRFHRRLLWPIRDVSGDVVGFGARRLFDDDRVEAKYLNTPETPIYKKSQLLYGVDVAKREIARQHRAVIVEGYTDVMACHLAGVTTAVATCGTAFGTDHVSVVRRLLMDSDSFTGEVIFTFDGDAAGMKAAERAFGDDQKFMSQTFVAIESAGLDPCELRQKSGDTALLDLVARRIPLVEFVLRTTVARFDLNTAEGQTAALDRGVPLVAQIKDRALRANYAARLAGLVGFGMEEQVLARVRGLERSNDRRPATPAEQRPAETEKVDDAVVAVEREVLKVALQLPAVAGPQFDALEPDAFLLPAHRSVREAIAAVGGASAARSGATWMSTIEDNLDEGLRSGAHALAVEPLRLGPLTEERYADAILARMQANVVARQITTLKSRLQRTSPEDHPDEHARLFGQLVPLEMFYRQLRDRANNSRSEPMRLFHRKDHPPAEIVAALPEGERLVSWADTADGGVVLATPGGLWWPSDAEPRLIGWQFVDKATWRDGVLTVVEAVLEDAVLLVDLPPVAVQLSIPRDLPPTVRARVQANVVRSEIVPIPGGAARFVARRVPGSDGLTWWARLEAGTRDSAATRAAVAARAEQLRADWEAAQTHL